MSNCSLEKRSLQKKYIVFFLSLGLIVTCVLCLVSQVSMRIKPIVNPPNSAPVLILKGNQQVLVDQKSSNSFQISFPILLATPLVANAQNSEQLTNKMIISDVEIKNIFGGSFSFHDLNIATRFVDFISTSQLLDLNVNASFYQSNLTTLLAMLYFLCIGILVSLIAFSGLFLIDNLLKLACFVVSKLVEATEHNPRIVITINSILLLVTLALSIWGCFVGLLFQDEGFFNLMAQYPQDVLTGLPSTYYQLTHLIFLSAMENLIVFRGYTIISSLVSILLLTYVVVKYINTTFKEISSYKTAYLLFILFYIVNCFQFAHHITPDYNNLSRLIVYGQVSILVMVLYNLVGKNTKMWILFLGVVSGVNFFIKFPEAIASVFMISILFIVIYRKSSWSNLLSFYSGVAVSMLVYFGFVQSLTNYLHFLSNCVYYSHLVDGHQALILLSENFNDIISCLSVLLVYLLIYHFVGAPLRGKICKTIVPLTAISLILLLSILSIVAVGRYFQLAFMYAQVSKLFLVVLAVIVYENIRNYKSWTIKQKQQYNVTSWLCLLLLIFTYLASLGTDTKILYHIMFHPSLIFAVIILQWWLFDENNASRYYLLLLLTVSVTVIFIQAIVYNNIAYINLFKQTTIYPVDNSKVFISEKSANSLYELKQKLLDCGYHNGDYIAGYYAMPDIVYALGGRSPVTPWFSPSTKGIPQTQRANQYLFSLMGENIKKHLFVIVNSEKLNSGLTTLGFDDPRKLIYCGSVNVSEGNNEFSIKKFTLFHYNNVLIQ